MNQQKKKNSSVDTKQRSNGQNEANPQNRSGSNQVQNQSRRVIFQTKLKPVFKSNRKSNMRTLPQRVKVIPRQKMLSVSKSNEIQKSQTLTMTQPQRVISLPRKQPEIKI